ncbi:hypothetical protein JCM11251_000865 [Rhodosporidiobolus azoricus]
MLLTSLTAALVAYTALPGASAFFKMNIDNILVNERTDPIVSPNTFSKHAHSIRGGSNFGPNATYESLRASECTSARAREDKSAYWTPTLFFQWANGSFTAVDEGGGLVYYLFRDHPSDKYPIEAFPEGFRMLTGDPTARTYTLSGNMKDAIGMNCLGSPSPTRVEGSGLPVNKYCKDQLRAEIRFPSCWDGRNAYLSDMSHVAYSAGESGPCPDTHPHRLVTLFYEVFFEVQKWENLRSQAKNPEQPFVFAMGDPTGFGWHGDFMNGWDPKLLQKAIETCLSPTSGGIDECKVLEQYDRSKQGEKQCKRTPVWDEHVVDRTLPSLPGCNPVTYTQKDAKAVKCSKDTTPKLLGNMGPTVFTGEVPPVGAAVLAGQPTTPISALGYRWQGCYADDQSTRAFPKGLNTASKTVAGCLNAAKAGGWKYAALEYHGECWVSDTLPKSSTKLDSSACGLTCTDRPVNYCGGASAMTVYKATGTTSKSKGKRHFDDRFEH